MPRAGTINMRRWPRSSVQQRPTIIATPPGPGVDVSVLTTAAAFARPLTQHSYPIGALTTVGVTPRAAAGKAMTFAVLTTAAAYMATGGVAPIDHDQMSRTFAGASSDIGFGTAILLDENGDPILDENGFPILVTVQGITKNVDATVLVTGAVHVGTFTVPTTQIATSVLTTFGGSTASVTTHDFSFGVETTVGVEERAGPLTRTTPISIVTTAGADDRAGVSHDVTTAAQTPVAASVQVGVSHNSTITVSTTGGALSVAGVSHNVSVSVHTSGAVYTFALLEAANSISVAVYTSGAGSTQAPTSRAATPLVVTTAGASSQADTLRATAVSVHTSGAGEARADGLTHDTTIEHVLTTLGLDPSAGAGREVFAASTTFAAASTAAIGLHDALIEALTTGAAHAHIFELIVQLCVEISAIADGCVLSAEADLVDIEVEQC